MKKGYIVSAVLLAVLAVLGWQRRQADSVSADISGLRSELEQIAAESERLRAAVEGRAAELAEREQQKNRLEQAAAMKPAALASSSVAANADSLLATRPNEYYWSDAGDTVWVPKEYLPQLGIRALSLDTNDEWRITEHAAAALVLNAIEQASLTRSLAEAVQRYRELARAHFSQVIWPTVEEEAKGLWRAKYQVSAFHEEAVALRQQFADSVREILHGEKAQYFLDFMAGWAETPFSAFGEKEMSILFEWTRTSDDQWALQITETGINNSRPVQCGQTTTRRLEATNIPPYWRPFIGIAASSGP